MAILTIQRERALAAFGLKYYIFFNCDRDKFIESLDDMPYPDILMDERYIENPLSNGETVQYEIPPEGGSFFLAAYRRDQPYVVTREVVIPPDSGDLLFVLRSALHPRFGLSIRIDPEGVPSGEFEKITVVTKKDEEYLKLGQLKDEE